MVASGDRPSDTPTYDWLTDSNTSANHSNGAYT